MVLLEGLAVAVNQHVLFDVHLCLYKMLMQITIAATINNLRFCTQAKRAS